MLTPSNYSSPILLDPSEVRVITLESVVPLLPLYGATLSIRNVDVVDITVTVESRIEVTGAPMGWDGVYSNTLVDDTVEPDGLLTVRIPVYAMDGVTTKHVVTITNEDGAATCHVWLLVNGAVDALSIGPAATQVIIP